MPLWVYNIPPIPLALLMIVGIEAIALIGLVLARRYLLPRLHYHDGVNDAVSGTVQAIGVFYAITVGLIAAGVWSTYSNAGDLVSHEAAAITALYRDVSSLPEPARTSLRTELRDYTDAVITQDWPAQRQEHPSDVGGRIVEQIQATLTTFEPETPGEQARYAETWRAFNDFSQKRRLRLDAVENGLSLIMWSVIWLGAAISIGVGYFFYLEDIRMHAIMIGLIAGFLGIVLFTIVVNDRPFAGQYSLGPDSYRRILDTLMATDR
ncbi:MAG TPA: hypothetical protein VFO07_15060 [Roseiflexaceae bacterium]|nr:hypothetical protein [Roseiflexaceae bacterium]